ncbi:hypothetical protein L1987_84684 [Smallanthus sonchifolius]|uniref:Uncharacterized protein n=1 Tax=Smallanthus sonchifolius TaxID=185202 RepID=A0ACB8XVK7_9ASTR|nr:hypothetical protein L1987_84684 [Smallanthus sonchifolius]
MSILVLSDNNIEGLVPEWILNNSQETLQILDLSNNSISGFHQHPHFLPWVRLKFFSIGYNQLQGRLPIPPLSMVVYSTSNNNLMGEIPPLICKMKSLQVLDLSSNNMTGTLPLCLGNISNLLLVLDLKRNNFQGPMMNTFTHGSSIKRIDLSENQFTGQLSKSLVNCTNLEVLILRGNSFHDVFPFWLGTLSKLEVLILGSNKFYGSFHDLTSVGSQFPKLQIIDLSDNGFSGQLPDKLFLSWNAMKHVDAGKLINVILELYIDPSESFIAPYSTILTNKYAKTEYNIFIVIDLSCNHFEGHILQSLSDLHGLKSLNLSNNHFTGHILLSFGNLKNLESLDLSRNELSGEIPHELVQLNFLEIFNVSFNHFHGSIPQGKQFNTFDNASYMGNPGLCGELLYKECPSSKASTVPSTSDVSDSLLPNDRSDLIVISLGVGSGLVIGIFIGNFLYVRYDDWFIERFQLRKEKWIRLLSNKSRK